MSRQIPRQNLLRYQMKTITHNISPLLHKIPLGTVVNIKGTFFQDNLNRLGTLCWIGEDVETHTWLCVVEICETCIACHDPMAASFGEWCGQRLWHIQKSTIENIWALLIPIDFIDPVDNEESLNYPHHRTRAHLCSIHDKSMPLYGNHLGCIVRSLDTGGGDWEGRLLWTGRKDNVYFAVVKLFTVTTVQPMNDAPDLAELIQPNILSDASGPMVVVYAAVVSPVHDTCKSHQRHFVNHRRLLSSSGNNSTSLTQQFAAMRFYSQSFSNSLDISNNGEMHSPRRHRNQQSRRNQSSSRNQASTSSSNRENREKCCACQERPSQMLIVPCGHLCLCLPCGKTYSQDEILKSRCPLCRTEVSAFTTATTR